MVTIDGADYMTADEVCAILAVKPATLYAYVSRGRLRSYRQGMRRQRLYSREEVDQLARVSPAHQIELPDAQTWAEIH